VRIQSRNKYIARLLARLLKINGYRFEFVYHEELYDPDITELAFLNQQLAHFDEHVEQFREEIQKAIEDAAKKQTP
jgi:NAD(P)H-dependent FMN reductase